MRRLVNWIRLHVPWWIRYGLLAAFAVWAIWTRGLAGGMGLLVLVYGVPLNLLVTVLLWGMIRDTPKIGSLRDRRLAAVGLLLNALVFGLIFFSNDAVPPLLPPEVTKVVTRFVSLLLAVVPATAWLLWRYSNGNDGRESPGESPG